MNKKLYTEITNFRTNIKIGLKNRVFLLGSCFSDNISNKLFDSGFNICSNPFGSLYNIESIVSSVEKLQNCQVFLSEDCVQMGAGSELICSFSHHTSFARRTEAEFLENANSQLIQASKLWHNSDIVIVTLGTAWVWRRNGKTVANCLKRPSAEFSRELLDLETITNHISKLINTYSDKQFIFTVSPIRHLGEFGAHSNTISKSLLHIAIDKALEDATNAIYFPAYEIMIDELRDYRFYASDLVHPSDLAIDIIWEKFLNNNVKSSDYQQIKENFMASRKARHKEMFK